MLAFLVAISMAVGAAACGWHFDVRLTGRRISTRLILSLVLLAACTWLSTLILASEVLVDAQNNATFLFRMRVITVFVVLMSMLDAVAVAIFTAVALRAPSSTPRWRLWLIPILALAAFALALYLVDSRSFLPKA